MRVWGISISLRCRFVRWGSAMNLRFREVNPAWALAAIFFVVLLAYANHFRNTFHFDDSHTVTDNPWIRSLHNVPRFFADGTTFSTCLLYTSPSPRDRQKSRMPSSA